MKTRRFIPLAFCLGTLFAFQAGAHPYASGLTNQSGTISWVLNESATDVKILFDNGTVTNDLGSAPVVGTNTFTLGAHTNFSIVVYKVGSNTLNQISNDGNMNNVIFGPRGVAVNTYPKTGNFGRIYVASANPGNGNEGRVTTKGIYGLDAASGDCLNLVNTAATAGITFGTSTTFSPFKLAVGPDDFLYVGDAATSVIGGVWKVDANLSTSSKIFNLANPSTNTVSKGTNFGRAVGTPNVSGSLANGNLVLTLTSWDLNLTNSAGKFGNTASSYQNIYTYNIGAGPLPWTNYPTIITNPIGIGIVNVVTADAQVAPDGKYFLSVGRTSPSDGDTNVCVLSSTGAILWDSKTQSSQYFGDTTNDHLSMNNRSIAVSPDDKYVVIQGSLNNNFYLMSLTNGVPDITTLVTNLTVGASGGSTCYAATWDAADNIYVTSGGSQSLHVLSPGMTSTCITSNTANCTNGGFTLSLSSAAVATIVSGPTSKTVECSSNASFTVQAAGPGLGYQWYLGSSAIGGATNATLNLGAVSTGQSGNSYKVVVTNSMNAVTSQVAVLTVVDTTPPVVSLNGNAIMSLLQGGSFTDPGATATDGCSGSRPITTNGTVNVNTPGAYVISYKATDTTGNSATNTRTVYVQGTSGAPSILLQPPANQVAQCTGPTSFRVIASGAMPLHYQWYSGSTPLSDGAGISGSTTSNLTLSGTLLTQAGSYKVVITNSINTVTSQVANLSVMDSTVPVVTVTGSADVTISQGTPYADAGATASDSCVGSLTVTISGSVNVNVPASYVLTYSATNGSGNSATAKRVVTVTPSSGAVAAAAANIIPLPVTLQPRPGTFTLCPAQPVPPVPSHALMQILVDGASLQTGQYLAASLFKSTGYQFLVSASSATNAVKNSILITTSNAISTLAAEGYELTVAPDSVVIRAPAQGGTFYGVQSLLQLLPPQIYAPRIVSGVPWVAPCVYVQDQPSYSWRGVMLDVARHFFNKDQVKVILDAMAMHKLNTFHWHLVDDQAWRLEMTNYPNLTVAGAFRDGLDYGLSPRCSDATNSAGQYGGYYTQADAKEIVAYAAERHITVVPELEMPAHSTCGLLSYPQFGCGNPVGDYDMDYPSINYGVDLYSLGTTGTMAFLEDTLAETMAIFPSYYIHCGGDEVVASGDTQWNTYGPDVAKMASLGITPNGTTSIVSYQHWFSVTIANFVQGSGHMMMGWTEFENGGILTNAALMDWETGTSSRAVAAATNGQPVVMSPDSSCYINYVEGNSSSLSIEPPFIVGGSPAYLTVSNVYAFNPIPSGLPPQFVTNILGAQCNLWGEYVPSFRNVMFKMFPRETAMAEITWTPTNIQNFANFTNRLAVQQQRFVQMGLNYDHESIPQIGTWGPTVSSTPTTVNYDITANVTAAGEIDVSFVDTNGVNGLSISSAALLQNGVQVDIDNHAGYTGNGSVFPVYIFHLPETKPGATYTIQAVISGAGGTSTSGTVYLPNWN